LPPLFGEPNRHQSTGLRGPKLLLNQALFQELGLQLLPLSARQAEALVPGRNPAIRVVYHILQEGYIRAA
jgi:hypothetical protein